ncbi:MAG: MmcQ/YjbR family DNA-binding protein [Prevotellaceae bacterium]|jgi:predicted DNA-binding protein (MmcQ/YjbR family)|nr:MmcQ/YjbR family DNA-binding protein [Prevotellaceae bacterium]
MNIEELHEYCLSIEGATTCFPFDDVTLVMKVVGKMFALIPLDATVLQICLKCDPEQAIELRERYACVEPAHHFNKKYWNTIYPNQEMPDKEVKKWIRHSVDEVIKKVPKRIQAQYSSHLPNS